VNSKEESERELELKEERAQMEKEDPKLRRKISEGNQNSKDLEQPQKILNSESQPNEALATSRPRRTQKPTPVYEIFQAQQQMAKRSKRPSIRESDSRRSEIAKEAALNDFEADELSKAPGSKGFIERFRSVD
jgi:hypothetical protein